MTSASLLLPAVLLQLQLQAPVPLDPARIREQVVDPRGRYCFRIDAGWKNEGHDVESDSITVRHGATEVRLSHGDRCPLIEDAQPSDRTRLEGRYGPGRIATYPRLTEEPDTGRAEPFFGCVDVESGWLILQGIQEPTDRAAVRQIAETARIDCNRFDPDDR